MVIFAQNFHCIELTQVLVKLIAVFKLCHIYDVNLFIFNL